MSMATQRFSLWRIFAAPLAIAVLSVVGLVAALVAGEGVGHVLSWIALGVPVAAVIWGRLRRAR